MRQETKNKKPRVRKQKPTISSVCGDTGDSWSLFETKPTLFKDSDYKEEKNPQVGVC